ncbi:MAG: cytochrome c [gamma proteobacterium symbiont of Phacoides pectinatus]
MGLVSGNTPKLRVLAALCLLLLAPLATAAPPVATGPVSSERQAALRHLVRHDCGSCHGMRLEGGLGPSLKPAPLERFTTKQLALTITYGRPGTPMPPWGPFLTRPEALWIADTLKQGELP